ncbi:MAG: hypothetical protein KY451_12405, partial [Actinobacteria bacterium]|nr:hypothetical protein [Actinomycetota bacterium]MBW3648566.1 hypothetical protein [Actinomycetota bacterium]
MRTALRGMGQLLMTLGVVVLLFGVYSLYGTGLQAARAQSELRDDLRQSWATPPQTKGPGHYPGSAMPGEVGNV